MESLSLYFPHGDRLARVVGSVPLGTTLQQVIVLLAAGPGELGPPDARTAIELGDVVSVQLSAGVASVGLAPKFRDLPATEQRLAVAQLVLTLTERPGVGQVIFTIAGRPVAVPRANGSFGSRTVSSDNYVDLVDQAAPSSTDAATTIG